MSFGSLDLRTKEGKFAHDIKSALIEQLGGALTPAQQILVQLAAIKALRCELLCNLIFSDTAIKDVREYHLLAWMNGLRRDLEALGLEEPEHLDHRPSAQTLPDILARLPARAAEQRRG